MARQPTQPAYACPMHDDVRQMTAGKCTKCGMDMVPDSAGFPMLRHVAGNPWMLAGMAAAMLALMAAIMML